MLGNCRVIRGLQKKVLPKILATSDVSAQLFKIIKHHDEHIEGIRTYNLLLMKLSAAVGCGHDGATHLQVPGLVSILRRAGDRDGVDAAGVAVT